MKTFKSKFLFGLMLMALALSMVVESATAQGQGGYIRASSNSEFDTIASATANDTSLVYRNTTSYPVVDIEFKQNGILDRFQIAEKEPYEFRVLYIAADSTLRVQKRSLLGWMPVPIIVNGTAATKYTVSLRTGNAVLTARGRRE